jgi:hypothetical protein
VLRRDQVSRFGQGFAFGFVSLHYISYDCAKILEDLFRVVTVRSAIEQIRAKADIALVLAAPINDEVVSICWIHQLPF